VLRVEKVVGRHREGSGEERQEAMAKTDEKPASTGEASAEKKLKAIVRAWTRLEKAEREKKDTNAEVLNAAREAKGEVDQAVTDAEGALGTPSAESKLVIVIEKWKAYKAAVEEGEEEKAGAKEKVKTAEEEWAKAIGWADQGELALE
jgi:uncharacterized protein (UPF0335 family)